MAIITYPLNGITYDAEDVETYLCTRNSGVFYSGAFAPSVTGGNLKVTIGTGIAWIKNKDYAGKSVCSNEAVTLTLDAAGAKPRIDRIVLEFSEAENASRIKVLKGTPNDNPTPPAITRAADGSVYQLALCDITVAANAAEITAANVTDKRLDPAVCGLMTDAVTSIDTTVINATFAAFLDNWRTAIENVTAGTDTMLKSVFNAAGRTGQVAFAPDVLYDGAATTNVELDLPTGLDSTDYAYFDLQIRDQAMNEAWARVSASGDIVHLIQQRFVGSGCWIQIKTAAVTISTGYIYFTPNSAVEVDGIGADTTTGVKANNLSIIKVLGTRKLMSD